MGSQRIIQGTVVSNKMDKTVVVSVGRKKKHPLYHKVMSVTERYKAHDEDNGCKLGDVVRIQECRPLSRDKRWRVVEVLTRGDVAEVAPDSIGRDIEATAQVASKAEAQL
ncbi:MAG: 30S ribosomal protein S17 [Anaerolinea sp.]|nr:30S ribosomal protein S17 [Anaerolinea sp.]